MEFFSHFIVPPIINCILFRCYTGLRRDLNEAAVRGGGGREKLRRRVSVL